MAEVYIDVTTGAGETTYSGTENGSGTPGDPWTDYPSFVNHADNPVGTDNHVNIRGVITVGNAAGGNQCDLGSLTDNASNNYTFRRWDGVPTTWAEMTDSGFQIPGSTGGIAVFNFDSYSCENLLLEVTSGGTYRSDHHAYQGYGTVDRCVIICGGNCFRSENDESALTRSLCISKLNSCYYGANSGDWMDIYLYHNTFIIDGGSVAQILELRNFSHHLINNVMYVINGGSATNDVALVGTGSIDAAASEYNAGTLASGSQPTDLQDNWLQLTADPFDDLVEFQPAGGGALDTNLGSSNNPPGFTVDGFGNNYASPNPEMGWRAVESGIDGDGAAQAQPATVSGQATRIVTGDGAAGGQDATASGQADRIIVGSGAVSAQSATVAGAATLQLKIVFSGANNTELRDENGAPVASRTINWEWYDKTGDTNGDPDDSGQFVTNASGEHTLQLPSTTLLVGQYGTLLLTDPADPLNIRASIPIQVE